MGGEDPWHDSTLKSKLPDVVAHETLDEDAKYIKNVATEITLTDIEGRTAKYALDSMVVRDTQQRHFCALLTCGGDGYGFDGESYARMTKFNWREKALRKGRAWTFEGSKWSGSNEQIVWKLKKSYSIALYYRV